MWWQQCIYFYEPGYIKKGNLTAK